MRRRFFIRPNDSTGVVLVAVATLVGCAVRRQTKIPVSQLPPTPLSASAGELIARLNAQSEKIQTLTATVDFAPTSGSVYSGVIKEYRDVRGFILIKKPAMIRIIGQAPVVRTDIFDMVSDGQEFRLSIPPKNKFIVGKAALDRPAKNSLENMRPQHFLDALLVPGIDLARDRCSFEEAEEDGQRYYVLTVFQPGNGRVLFPARKAWFERSKLELARAELFGSGGALVESAAYSAYRDYQGVNYPSEIRITRPVEDYRVAITIEKATLNQEIAPEKFDLPRPPSAELLELGSLSAAEAPHGH